MALNGKYKFVREDGQLAHLIAIGIPESKAKSIIGMIETLEISIKNDDVCIKLGDGKIRYDLKLDQETNEITFGGKPVKSKATLNGNELCIATYSEDEEWTRVYSVSGSTLTMDFTTSKPGVPDGKRIFERL